MDVDLRSAMIQRPTAVFIVPAFVLSLSALPPTPSAVPLSLLLAVLQLFLRIVIPREGAGWRLVVAWIALSLGIAITHLQPSLQALSTAGVSLFALYLLSSISSFVALCVIALDVKIYTRLKSAWAQLTFFPLLWTAAWQALSFLSPLGRLVTWSPVRGLEGYDWMAPYAGPLAKDWVVAAWASLGSHWVGEWFIGESPDTQLPETTKPRRISSACLNNIVLGAILTSLMIPSYFVSDIPSSLSYSHATPLVLGCVLPPSARVHGFLPTLDDFIDESKKLTNANVLLWPEGAVSFNSHAERDAAFEKVRANVRGPYVGVAFKDSEPVGGGRNLRRTGLALLSSKSNETYFSYYKRALVPIAESFSLSPSLNPPPLYTINLLPPKDASKDEWAPGPNHTRPVSITASICLDFAQPAPFRELNSRPSLVLAPARTWHTSVGVAMWEQAKMRAQELGSTILWCDGGEGGVSGAAGGGLREVKQVGPGSWVRRIGVEWPFDEQRTIYARVGGSTVLAALLGLVGLGWAVDAAGAVWGGSAVAWLRRTFEEAQRAIQDRKQRRIAPPTEDTPLLI